MANYTVSLEYAPLVAWVVRRDDEHNSSYMEPVLLADDESGSIELNMTANSILGVIPALPGYQMVRLRLMRDGKPAMLRRGRDYEQVEYPLGVTYPGDKTKYEEFHDLANKRPCGYFDWYFRDVEPEMWREYHNSFVRTNYPGLLSPEEQADKDIAEGLV